MIRFIKALVTYAVSLFKPKESRKSLLETKAKAIEEIQYLQRRCAELEYRYSRIEPIDDALFTAELANLRNSFNTIEQYYDYISGLIYTFADVQDMVKLMESKSLSLDRAISEIKQVYANNPLHRAFALALIQSNAPQYSETDVKEKFKELIEQRVDFKEFKDTLNSIFGKELVTATYKSLYYSYKKAMHRTITPEEKATLANKKAYAALFIKCVKENMTYEEVKQKMRELLPGVESHYGNEEFTYTSYRSMYLKNADTNTENTTKAEVNTESIVPKPKSRRGKNKKA